MRACALDSPVPQKRKNAVGDEKVAHDVPPKKNAVVMECPSLEGQLSEDGRSATVFPDAFGLLAMRLEDLSEFINSEESDVFLGLCAVSTYFTSAVWFGFVACAALIRVLKGSSRVVRLSLTAIGESALPGRTTAGLVTLLISSAYGLILAIGWAAAQT